MREILFCLFFLLIPQTSHFSSQTAISRRAKKTAMAEQIVMKLQKKRTGIFNHIFTIARNTFREAVYIQIITLSKRMSKKQFVGNVEKFA